MTKERPRIPALRRGGTWGTQVAEAWSAYHWPIIAMAGLAAIALGFAGFLRYESIPGALYRSLQLFVLEFGDVERPLPLSVEVARFLAPAVAGAAAIQAALSLFRQQVEMVRIRRMRDHIVIVGLGEKGLFLTLALDGGTSPIVAIERDPGSPGISRCREHGVPILVGDASDPLTLRHARVDRARAIVVMCGPDDAAAQLGFAVHRAVSEAQGEGDGRRRSLPVFIEVEDVERWRHLNALAIARAGGDPGLEFFNVEERAAAELASNERLREVIAAAASVAVVGDGTLVPRVAAALSAAPGSGDGQGPPRIHLVGPEAERDVRSASALVPEGAIPIDAVETEIGAINLIGALQSRATTPTAVILCASGPAEALSLSIALRSKWPAQEAMRIVAVLPSTGEIAKRMMAPVVGVELFGAWDAALEPALLEQSSVELLARANHEVYRKSQLALGQTPDVNRSLVEWQELPESLRESNRMFAESIGSKLAELGCALVPAALAGDQMHEHMALTTSEVERLAELEHERWVRDLEADGWTHGSVKDPEAKRHPLLQPWSELAESEREKDRVLVAALPEVLAEMGFGLRPTQPGEPRPSEGGAPRRSSGT